MNIFTQDLLFGLIGGLGFFLFGLSLMGQGLQKITGDKIRKILETTENTIVAVLVGVLFSVILQDGGAAMVLVVGLLSSGLLRSKQTVAMMLGVNLGITVIVQVIALKLENYPLLAVGVGFLLYSFGKRRLNRYLGQTILGFGLVFIGLNIFTSVMRPLAGNILVRGIISEFGRFPLWGYFFGALSSSLVQSNTAVIGLLQTLAQQTVIQGDLRLALLPLSASLPFLFGTNLGICTTASLASFKGSLAAKRAVAALWIFNLVTALVVIVFIHPFADLVHGITVRLWRLSDWIRETIFLLPAGYFPQEADLISREIAMAHTIYNLLLVILWLPLVTPLTSFTKRLVKDWGRQDEFENLEYLNEKMFDTPSVALRLATKEILKMSEVTLEMLNLARIAFVKGHLPSVREVEKREDIVDNLQEKITLYLSTLLSRTMLTSSESRYLAGLVHVVNDVERMADHANNIARVAEAKIEEKLPFSELAMNELALLYGKVIDVCKKAFHALAEDDSAAAKQVLEREEAIDKLKEEMRQNHINRLNQGRCWPGSGIIYLELINNLERVADHAVNIVQLVLKDKEGL